MSDAVNPKHYQFSNGVQVIDITENLTSNGGQAVQYIARSTRLDGVNKGSQVEDLDKAIWFCQREKERLAPMMPVAAPVEAPVTRVFKVGDPEPADKETITLSGYSNVLDEDVLLRFGDYDPTDGSSRIRWWDVKTGDDNTWARWDNWLEAYEPLTEVL